MMERVHGIKSLFKIKKASGDIRQIEAVGKVTSVREEHYNITWEDFTVSFETFGNFWFTDQSQSKNINITSDTVDNLQNLSNVNSEPQIYYSFVSASGVTGAELEINGISCIYTGTINTGDVLVFDCIEKQLFLNGSIVEYT